MPRKKTKHVQIQSERARKTTLRRRLDSLFKRANELSVLCGIETSIVIHNRNEGQSTLWPSQDQVMDGIMKFLAFPERERLKKMVLHEKFLTDKLQEIAGKLLKLKNKNEETEMGLLMNQLIEGTTLDELDLRQVNGLYHLIDGKLKRLQNRREELDVMRGQLSVTDISHFLHPCFPVTGAPAIDTREYQWFGDTVTGTNNNLDLLKETDVEPHGTEVTESFIGRNQGELADVVWPKVFSP